MNATVLKNTIETQTKRVACLYRVSSLKQVDDDEIPLQRNACHKYINRQNGWMLVEEYQEKGVSGFNQSAEIRDVLQKVIKDAKNNKFDILLLFINDRLGRIANEYTETIETLSQYVEIYTVDKGDITIRTHTDSLKTYVDGWQSQGESMKISTRVTEKHIQMTEEGQFRGGIAPYGYKLILSGQFSQRDKKQRKELFDIVIDEEEAEVIRFIYKLAYEYGYGQNRIAQHLNESNKRTREGKKWSATSINYLLKNPIYKGYPAYGKVTKKKKIGAKKQTSTTQNDSKWILPYEKVEKLAIVSEEIWDKVRKMRKSRAKQNSSDIIPLPNKGKLLFVGFIKCGHCGSPLVTTQNKKTWVNKDGTTQVRYVTKYRCYGKQSLHKDCDGASTYSQSKIEETVLEHIKDYLNGLRQYDFEKELSKDKNNAIKKYQKELSVLEKSKKEKYKDIMTYEDSIPKALRGEGGFSAELLSSLLKKANDELNIITQKIKDINENISSMILEISDVQDFQKALPKWSDIFENAPHDKKKMMLLQIVNEIRAYNDHIEVDLKIHIQQFADSVSMGCVKQQAGRAYGSHP